MPFDFLETIAGKAPSRPSISYQRNTTKAATKAGDRKPKLVIALPQAMSELMKHEDGRLYRVAIGKGTDAGEIQIARLPGNAPATAKASAIAPSAFKHGLVFRFGFVPLLGSDAAAKEYVDAIVGDGMAVLDAPAWFKA